MENQNTLLFIPDISGFTNFVNETEIEHSGHIISELLEILINSNSLGLEVSEIEGDAILFFKQSILPTLEDLILQSEKMFLQFHEHLIRYENERICRCGACKTASQLSLKFVIHRGDVNIIKVKNHRKLHGKDVITAHRLLKNNIELNEYVLLTESFSNQIDDFKNAAYQILPGTQKINSHNSLNYYYFDFGNLLESISEPSKIIFEKSGKPILSKEFIINKPMGEVYFNIQDFNKRMLWNPAIKQMTLNEGNLNKTGVVHQCLVNNDLLSIKTLGLHEENNTIEYAERAENVKIFKEITTSFKLEKHGNATKICVENVYLIKPLFNILNPIIKMGLKNKMNELLKNLKKFSEK